MNDIVKHQIFILPFAGSSVKYYNKWITYFNENIQVELIEMAGRGTRKADTKYNNFDEAASDLFKIIKNKVNTENFYIFGHSLGAILAYEISLKFQNEELNLPKKLFLSGRTSPQYRFHENKESLSSDDIINELQMLGVEDITIYKHPRAGKYYMSLLKSDYNLVNTYCKSETILKKVDGSIFYGIADPFSVDIDSWQDYFEKNLDIYSFSGSHFYINDNFRNIIEIINNNIIVFN